MSQGVRCLEHTHDAHTHAHTQSYMTYTLIHPLVQFHSHMNTCSYNATHTCTYAHTHPKASNFSTWKFHMNACIHRVHMPHIHRTFSVCSSPNFSFTDYCPNQPLPAPQLQQQQMPLISLMGTVVPQPPPLTGNVDPTKIEEIRRTVYVGNLNSNVSFFLYCCGGGWNGIASVQEGACVDGGPIA